MRSERGFTLLEVLIAFAITAFALAALFRGGLEGLRSASVAGSYQEGIARARSRLAMIGHGIALVPGEIGGDDGGGYRWRIRIVPISAATATPAGRVLAIQLYSISVAVSWQADGHEREIRLDSKRMAATVPGQS
jgi:general secretion pathway protein I